MLGVLGVIWAFGVFLKFHQVRIVAAIPGAGGLFQGRGRAGEERQTGRKGEGFLATGEEHVDPQLIEFDFHRAERADRIHDKGHVREFFFQTRNFRQRAHGPGRGFVMDQGQGIEAARRKFFRIASARIGWPQSTWSASAVFAQRRATSSHLSEKAPHMQQSTFRATRLRMAPSMTPQAEQVPR